MVRVREQPVYLSLYLFYQFLKLTFIRKIQILVMLLTCLLF